MLSLISPLYKDHQMSNCTQYKATSLSLKTVSSTSEALHGKLRTKDVLLKWDKTINGDRVLCECPSENLQHLFFECSYSTEVSQAILFWFKWQRNILKWEHEYKWIQHASKSKAPRGILLRAALAVVVHALWGERNSRIFIQNAEQCRN